MARVELSSLARQDLAEIGLYIAEKSGSVEIATRLLDTIEETCQLLGANPKMGERRPEFATGQYRSFSVGNYVIYFRPTEDGILVARVLHGARDHRGLL
jgi:toxin ParE1/3/4